MKQELEKQAKYFLKKGGFCIVEKQYISLKAASNFAAVNNLTYEICKDHYVFRTNTIQKEFQQIKKREQYRHINQHVLFTVLATVFFLLLWLDLFNI